MKWFTSVIIIFVLLAFAAFGWWQSQLSPASSDKETKTVIIPKGAGVDSIANLLKKEDLIKSPLAFKILVKQKRYGSKLQAGTFKLSPSKGAEEILNILIGGPDEVWVTFLEGWRVEEDQSELSKNFGDSSKKFTTLAKEGYTFPDTYLFPKEISMEKVAQILRDNFDKKYSEELKQEVKSKGLTEAQGVILASIVEREARSDEARKMVAGILLKRLKIGMKLDVDSTVQYALVPKGSENPPAGGWWKRNITKEDKEIDSPYNTYTNPGLPPAPICNPSLASLQAVANADSNTPYLYYYHDSKGNSHYAKTLEEHNENVANNP